MAKETEFKIKHRYNEIIKTLGLNMSDFEGKSAGETRSLVLGAVDRAKYSRSDSDIVSERPIKVMLGKKTYNVKPRSIGDETAWLERVGLLASDIACLILEHAEPILSEFIQSGGTEKKPHDVIVKLLPKLRKVAPAVIPFVITKFSKEIIELFFEYSEIDRDDAIKSGATHYQLYMASVEVFKTFILPFMVGLVRSMVSIYQSTGGIPKSDELTN